MYFLPSVWPIFFPPISHLSNDTLTFFSAVSELKGCYELNRGRGQLQEVLFMCIASNSNLFRKAVVCCIQMFFYISVIVLSIQN